MELLTFVEGLEGCSAWNHFLTRGQNFDPLGLLKGRRQLKRLVGFENWFEPADQPHDHGRFAKHSTC